MSNPRAKRCVECGYWLSIRTTVCYICETPQTELEQTCGNHYNEGTNESGPAPAPTGVTPGLPLQRSGCE